jgi:hypothetical protein
LPDPGQRHTLIGSIGMIPLFHRLTHWAAAIWHAGWGRVWFRLGSMDRARRRFERVLELRGDAFFAYVHLGRIACIQGDFAGWRREMEHARRTDPERFSRLSHPFDLFEPPPPGTPFEEAGERATWRAMRWPGPGSRRGPLRAIGLRGRGELMASAPQGQAGRHGPRTRPGLDDCGSDSERNRFQRLGPIPREELQTADLDDLCRRLQTHSGA